MACWDVIGSLFFICEMEDEAKLCISKILRLEGYQISQVMVDN